MLSFHLIGDFPVGRVVCSFVPSTFRPGAEVRAAIETAWSAAKARLGEKLFDGPMCRLESCRVVDNTLHLELSRTSYKPFLGTNLSNSALAGRFGRAALVNPVGLSCALVAADGFLMMGRRNGNVAYYPNRVHPFAWALEPGEDGQTDVFAEARRELTEELSFGESDVSEIRCLGIAEDRSLGQPEVIFLVRSKLSRKQIESQLDATEHVATFVVEAAPAGAERALRERELLTPVGAAAVLLWGRASFGEEWFERVSAGFIGR